MFENDLLQNQQILTTIGTSLIRSKVSSEMSGYATDSPSQHGGTAHLMRLQSNCNF